MSQRAEAFAESVLSTSAPLPRHDHAYGHVLLKELRKPRKVPKVMLAPSGEVAAMRIREVAWDLGCDLSHHRWIAHVARELGLNYSTMYFIVHAKRPTVSTTTVDQVARKTSIPVSAFYDPKW